MIREIKDHWLTVTFILIMIASVLFGLFSEGPMPTDPTVARQEAAALSREIERNYGTPERACAKILSDVRAGLAEVGADTSTIGGKTWDEAYRDCLDGYKK